MATTWAAPCSKPPWKNFAAAPSKTPKSAKSLPAPPSNAAATFKWPGLPPACRPLFYRFAGDRLLQLPHIIRQILARNGMDVRIHQPGKDGRHTAAQSHEFDLDIYSVIHLQVSRVKVQSPEITVVVANGAFTLVFFPGISHLRDAHRFRSRVNVCGIALRKLNVELCVVNRGHYGVPVKAEVDAEMLSIMAKQFGALHIRFEEFRVMRVVLSHLKHLLQPGLGNKSDGQPVMDEPVGNLNFVSVFLRGDGLDVNLAALQATDLLCSLALGEGIQVQELSRSGEFALYSRFGHFFVTLKRFRRAGLQLRCAGSCGI